ncbi:alpha/beta fold hydrolase [Aquisalimonas sp.]|uniref:alpha/beta fold hydrolase n=1 Tax=unclassified Aquisalimonas TaxID=2644645 RepID=UPI0025BF792C|nr:alpha/beta fold hydrolase [Aquisalimonas sp.]
MPYLTTNGFQCWYDHRVVDTAAPTVVFCNGIMSTLEGWDRQLEVTDRLGYNALRFEYRGQWRSELTRPWPWTFDTHADDLLALLDALDIRGACHVVGTSYGGFVAMRFAARHAARTESLMVLTTAARIRPLPQRIVTNWRAWAEAGDLHAKFHGMIPDLYSEGFLARFGERINAGMEATREGAEGLADFCEGQVALHDTSFRELVDGDAFDALGRIQCPTLVVAAEADRLYPPEDNRAVADAIRDSQFVTVPGAGHALVVERPRLVNLLLAGHLTV